MSAARRRNSWSAGPNSLGRASVALGILAAVLAVAGIVVIATCPANMELLSRLVAASIGMGMGLLLAILAIILGAVGLGRKPKRPATVGLVVSIATVVAMLATGPLVLLPSLTEARQIAGREVSATNLRLIGLAAVSGSLDADHGDLSGDSAPASSGQPAFPPSLDAMIASGLLTEQGLRCTNHRGAPQRCYLYVPPLTAVPLSDTILACENAGCFPGGRNVLRVDGSVDWMTTEQFQAELAKPQNAHFAAALRRAK